MQTVTMRAGSRKMCLSATEFRRCFKEFRAPVFRRTQQGYHAIEAEFGHRLPGGEIVDYIGNPNSRQVGYIIRGGVAPLEAAEAGELNAFARSVFGREVPADVNLFAVESITINNGALVVI